MDRAPLSPADPGLPAPPPAGGSGLRAALRQTTFRSLRHRNYRLYFFGQLVSFTGSWMQNAALMWLMYRQTDDLRWPSYLLVAQVGPTVLLGTWGGQLADRWPKRAIIRGTQAAFLVNAVVLAVLAGTGLAFPLLILALQAVNGLVQAIDLPARLAFVPDLVPRDDLINAVGLNSLLFNSARAVGPAVTGVLFATVKLAAPLLPPGADPVTVGAVCCFGVNAVSYVAVLFALGAIRVPGTPPAVPHPDADSALAGVRYLARNRTLGGLVLLTLVLCVFAWPVLTLFPAYTREVLGRAEESYSSLVSALGGGALVAAFTTATFGSPKRRPAFLLAGAAATAGGVFGLSAVILLPAAVWCAAWVGFGLILFLSTSQSTLQLAVPDDVRGRVMSVWAIVLSASAPLGHLIAGQLAARPDVGLLPVLRVMALGVAGVAVALALLLTGRELRR